MDFPSQYSLRILLYRYASQNSNPNIANYVNNRLKGITNLNFEKTSQLLNSFSAEWREKFESLITDEQKDALGSIVANRHNIAHGRSVDITFAHLKNYYKNVIKVIEIINDECLFV